jgi:hypothetical protein
MAWESVVVRIITIDPESNDFQKTYRHVVESGIPKPTVLLGDLSVDPSDVKVTNRAVFASHHSCALEFVESGLHHTHDLLVLEDDVRFRAKAKQTVGRALQFLRRHRKGWHTLHVGHLPLAPCIPVVGARNLCHTPMPFGGHAYILNGAHVEELLRRVPRERWGRPDMVEGMTAAPLFSKYALCPSQAHQARIPREMAKIVGRSLMTYTTGEKILEHTMGHVVWGLLLFLLLLPALLLATRRRRKHTLRQAF